MVAVLWLTAAACGGDGSDDASPATSASPTTTAAGAPATSRPCDSQGFLEVVRSQGEQFGLAPDTLRGLTPAGPPKCDSSFSTQVFAGPPADPGPFSALFGVAPNRPSWELVGINCKSSVANRQREIC